jgi:hypothetical protein
MQLVQDILILEYSIRSSKPQFLSLLARSKRCETRKMSHRCSPKVITCRSSFLTSVGKPETAIAVRTGLITQTGCLLLRTESLGVSRVGSGVASLDDVSLFENGDERAAARACCKVLRRLAISRRNCWCLWYGARENPTVTRFATVGFKWSGPNPLRNSNRDISFSKPPERSEQSRFGPL